MLSEKGLMLLLILKGGFGIYTDSISELSEKIINPQFHNTSRYRDWRFYIPYEIQQIWDHLSEDTRISLYCLSQKLAEGQE